MKERLWTRLAHDGSAPIQLSFGSVQNLVEVEG